MNKKLGKPLIETAISALIIINDRELSKFMRKELNMDKNDINSGHDNLINGILAAPLMGAVGGVPGVVASVLLGAVADVADSHLAEINRNKEIPDFHSPKTFAEIDKEQEQDINATVELEALMVNAETIDGKGRKGRRKEYYEITHEYQKLICHKGYIPNGKLGMFYRKERSIFPVKEWPAELYYRPTDFLTRLKKDLERYSSSIELYQIEHNAFNGGAYMYTANHGGTYVVCTKDYRYDVAKRKENRDIG